MYQIKAQNNALLVTRRFYFQAITNKTVGCHRHTFRPPILLKMPFTRMKKFSKILFLHIFSNSFKFENFLVFLQKNFTMKVEKTFLRNITIRYVFCSKFPTSKDFEKFKFFSKEPIYFLKEPKFLSF